MNHISIKYTPILTICQLVVVCVRFNAYMKPEIKHFIFLIILVAISGGAFFASSYFGLLPKRNVQILPGIQQEAKIDQIAEIQQSEQKEQEKDVEEQAQKDSDNKNSQTDEEIQAEKIETTNKDADIKKDVTTKTTTTSKSSSSAQIVEKLVSWGFEKSSSRKIDTIIVHTSYDASGSDPYDTDGVIAQWKEYGVAPHYLIARDGTTYQLVADQNIAWHAGVSKMPDGRTNVNDFSIGVEVINTKDAKFSDDEYEALNDLITTLKDKYDIKNTLGHDDIAPGRKTDPWGMEWSKVNK